MIQQDFTLHTHTSGFDGINTPREMVARATDMGFKTIGISNHFIIHPDIAQSKFYKYAQAGNYASIYNVSLDAALKRFVPHYQELEDLASKSQIRVLRGLEVDFFDHPDWYRDFLSAVKQLRPDYLIGSCHFVSYHGGLCNVHDIAAADVETQRKMLFQYWANVRTAARSGIFSWLAHLDLPVKVGLGKEPEWADVEACVLETMGTYRVPLEINTSGRFAPYPSARILEMAAATNVPVLLSDDAHRVENIGRGFEGAARLAESCGIKKLIKLQKLLAFSDKSI